MSDASWALQQALYQTLSTNTGVQALLGNPPRLHDDVPEDAIFPYVTLGEVRSRDWPGTEGGQEHDLRFQIWSRHGGRAEIKQIMAAIYDVLHDGVFAVTNSELINCRYVFADLWQQPDNETYHGVVRYRAVTMPQVT